MSAVNWFVSLPLFISSSPPPFSSLSSFLFSSHRHIAEAKTSYDFEVVLVRGIAANWLVCLAVFVAITADDVSGKILAILLTVAAFVAPGFEVFMFFFCKA